MSGAPGATPPAVTVIATDDRAAGGEPAPVDVERCRALAEAVLVAEGVTGPAELDLLFVDVDVMADLNRTYLGGDGPTDVLAFPLDADLAEPDTEVGRHPRLLGDVVVCPAIARRNAGATGYEPELALLVVHGVLHVLGMDHAEPDEEAAMVARQRVHLAAAGFERGDQDARP